MRAIFLILSILLAFQSQAQNFTLVKSIAIEGIQFEIDNIGNTYVVKANNKIQKINPDGTFAQFYAEIRYGKIGLFNVLNPLKPLAYYPSYNIIKILDVTLSDKGILNLMTEGYDRVNALCLSLDNNIWIYDEINFRLKKISENLEVITESENLTTLLQMPIKPNFIIEKDNMLMLNDPKVGILVFDVYGTYYKTIPIKNLQHFQKIKQLLYYFIEGKLYSYHLQKLEIINIPLPDVNDKILDVKIEKNTLAILTEKQLLLYSF